MFLTSIVILYYVFRKCLSFNSLSSSTKKLLKRERRRSNILTSVCVSLSLVHSNYPLISPIYILTTKFADSNAAKVVREVEELEFLNDIIPEQTPL